MKRIAILLLFFTTIYIGGNAQHVGVYDTIIPHSGTYRDASLYVPVDYDPQNAYPLIIGMHGGGAYPDEIRDIFLGFADSVNAILICPDDPSFDMTVIASAEIFAKKHLQYSRFYDLHSRTFTWRKICFKIRYRSQ